VPREWSTAEWPKVIHDRLVDQHIAVGQIENALGAARLPQPPDDLEGGVGLAGAATLPTFREAYRKRRCILPVDGFFEWKAIKGQKAKQPYAIAMKDGSPFGIAGIWENWKQAASGEWVRTFAILTTNANDLVADIHDRMPAILSPSGYTRWLSEEPDPRDLLRPFPSEAMRIWPISMRVNKPENDDASILQPVEHLTQSA
jgi:putative SOS response-associated peptidase YedK